MQGTDSLTEHLEAEGDQPVGGGYEGYDEDEHGYPHQVGDYVDESDEDGDGDGDVDGGDLIGDGVNVDGEVGGDVGGGGDDVDGNADAIDEMNHGLNSFDIYAAADAVGLQEVSGSCSPCPLDLRAMNNYTTPLTIFRISDTFQPTFLHEPCPPRWMLLSGGPSQTSCPPPMAVAVAVAVAVAAVAVVINPRISLRTTALITISFPPVVVVVLVRM